MLKISAQTWKESEINMRMVKNEENKLKMHDIQGKLGFKNTSDLKIKEVKGIYNKENITRQKKKKNIKRRLMMDLCTFLVILL